MFNYILPVQLAASVVDLYHSKYVQKHGDVSVTSYLRGIRLDVSGPDPQTINKNKELQKETVKQSSN